MADLEELDRLEALARLSDLDETYFRYCLRSHYQELRAEIAQLRQDAERSEIERALRTIPLFARYLDVGFWSAHYINVLVRADGKDHWFEGDKLCAILWYAARGKHYPSEKEADAALNADPAQDKQAGTVLSSSERKAPSSGSLPDTPGPASGGAPMKKEYT